MTAVLFRPERQNTPLKPARAPEVLQGFLNIQNLLNVKNGELTQGQLERYGQISFFLPDPNAEVHDYFVKNFNQIAPLDGNPNSISADDLVIRRPELPLSGRPMSPPPAKNSGESAVAAHHLNVDHLFND
ncbi:MAG: hypothetical protein K2X66_08600 [Cyanobacteria bacterium]|nr:hypothetical protein [Cyanobacteriota bacterium]